MPVIAFASSKGGAGKTTACITLACELARKTTVTLIDVDPNQHTAKWANRKGTPENISLIENADNDSIFDDIEKAQSESAFVLIDLEGTASMAVTSALSRCDFAVIVSQASQDDADEAIKTIKTIKHTEKLSNVHIPFSVLFTRTKPAIFTKNERHISSSFEKLKIDSFHIRLDDREAFKTVRSVGGCLDSLEASDVGGIDKARENAFKYATEFVAKLKRSKSAVKEVA